MFNKWKKGNFIAKNKNEMYGIQENWFWKQKDIKRNLGPAKWKSERRKVFLLPPPRVYLEQKKFNHGAD